MSLWEYKVITSGKGGFATPVLLEKFLNDLGRDEWEIIEFQTQSDNFLAFTGLARRPTQRDWTLQDAAAAAAKVEAEKLRAEFEAKFKAATTSGAAEERPASFLEEKAAPDDGLRKLIDTSRDADADADEEEAKPEGDWDSLLSEDELPTFFDAIKPHMRRNQRGPGMSVGIDYLAKKWDQSEDDLKGALVECGFTIPADEDADAEYLEFEGDLYWININRRGELWINTKEKPRPVFRAVKAQKVAPEEEPADARKEARGRKDGHGHKPEGENRKPPAPSQPEAAVPATAPEHPEPVAERAASAESAGASLPAGSALLEKIRPFMRRNRRGPGGSGSASFLCRAMKCREADLVAGFKALGLVIPGSANEKPTNVEIGNEVWWVNLDSRGNVWINGRDKKPGERAGVEPGAESSAPRTEESATEAVQAEAARVEGAQGEAVPAEGSAVTPSAPRDVAPEAVPGEPVSAPDAIPAAPAETAPSRSGPSPVGDVLTTVRSLLKETRTGAWAGKLERVAAGAGQAPDELVAALVAAGLAVPEKPREKPVFVERAGEIFWLNRNAKGELWLNAKASKFADKADGGEAGATESSDGESSEGGEKKSRRPRGRKKSE